MKSSLEISVKNIFRLITLFILVFVSINVSAKYDFVVDKNGMGDFKTIQDAIDASRCFPDQRIMIYVKNGEYHEKIKIIECNTKISLIGENKDSTIIWYDDYFDKMQRGRNSTFYTYTLNIEANDIVLENLTIANRAGRVGQAVALHITGDRCVVKNCRLLGDQDTLYSSGENSRQYYFRCYIEGTTDFIFGCATAYFQDCEIHSKQNSYITASNSPKNNRYGFIFNNCKLTADDEVTSVFLGRPWRDYAKAVFINCYMGEHIRPEGWDNWSSPHREETAYYAEGNNSGPGSKTESRVSWSHQLNDKSILKYSVDSVFNANKMHLTLNDYWYH